MANKLAHLLPALTYYKKRRGEVTKQTQLECRKCFGAYFNLVSLPFSPLQAAVNSINSIQEEGLGMLNISLAFNPDQCILTVRLIQAKDLVARDFSGTADTYCKLCLLPDRAHRLQTKVHKNSQNPQFNEEFLFNVYPTDLPQKTLEILVYDYDQFSRDECVGQLLWPLEHVDLSEDTTFWRPITQVEAPTDVSFFVFFFYGRN